MTGQVKPGKRGPEPDRLKIEGDPQDALRKLLTTPPPEAEPEEAEEEKPPRDGRG